MASGERGLLGGRESDFFRDDCFVVGRDLAPGIPEEERCATGVASLGSALKDLSAHGRKLRVDGVGRDRAVRNVDNIEARTLSQKADWQ